MRETKYAGLAGLDELKVAEIKLELTLGTSRRALARRYRVSTDTICAIAHGRRWADVPWPQGYVPGALRQGHYRAKLDAAKVAEIKLELARGTGQRVLAGRYGVSTAVICDIAHGRRWADVPWPQGYGPRAVRRGHYRAKLDAAKVAEIKLELARGTGQSVLARRYRVSSVTICGIAQGKQWAHVPWPQGYGPRAVRRGHYGAKLDAAKVAEIKLELTLGTSRRALAGRYRVSTKTICAIAQGKRWADVPWPSTSLAAGLSPEVEPIS
jgi:Mor family transcriptional regulator